MKIVLSDGTIKAVRDFVTNKVPRLYTLHE